VGCGVDDLDVLQGGWVDLQVAIHSLAWSLLALEFVQAPISFGSTGITVPFISESASQGQLNAQLSSEQQQMGRPDLQKVLGIAQDQNAAPLLATKRSMYHHDVCLRSYMTSVVALL
jgi:hypothetical protein